jgi:hypothetical protein
LTHIGKTKSFSPVEWRGYTSLDYRPFPPCLLFELGQKFQRERERVEGKPSYYSFEHMLYLLRTGEICHRFLHMMGTVLLTDCLKSNLIT